MEGSGDSGKRLAYGSFFAGKKGYIAPRFFFVFVDAFHPEADMETRWESGVLGEWEWKLWQLLTDEGAGLGTHEYRKRLGVSAKSGQSSLDTAVTNLQMTFDVSFAGNTAMLDKNGLPYNKAVLVDLTQRWAPAEWRALAPRRSHEEALETICRQALLMSSGGARADVEKVFAKGLKQYKRFAAL